jgi:phosphoserine phosphatase
VAVRLLFLDMEGTLVVPQEVVVGPDHAHHTSLWTRIFSELGPAAQADNVAMIEKWDGGGYRSYMDWVDDSLVAMRRHGFTKVGFDALVAETSYNPGVAETLHRLHDRGVRTAIVSGGFIEQARRAQQDLRIHHAYAATDLFWDEAGRLVHWNIYPSDFEGKTDFVRLMMREYSFGRDECAFVGDGANDVPIATTVGTSIAYNAHPALRAVADHAVNDFAEVLTIL